MSNQDDFSNPYLSPTAEVVAVAPGDGIQLGRYNIVRRGLQAMYYSVATLAVAVILFLAIAFLSGNLVMSYSKAGSMGILVAFVILGIVCICAGIAMLVGFCMCAVCPESNEKNKAFLTIGCFVLALIAGGVSGVMEVTSPNEEPTTASRIVDYGGSILNAISTIAFCLLMKQIGINISSEPLKASAKSTLNWYLSMFALFFIGAILLGMTAAAFGPGAGGSSLMFLAIVGVLLIGIALGFFFKFLGMLRTGIAELDPRGH